MLVDERVKLEKMKSKLADKQKQGKKENHHNVKEERDASSFTEQLNDQSSASKGLSRRMKVIDSQSQGENHVPDGSNNPAQGTEKAAETNYDFR